ncbi:hypothetical protein N7492_002644 [Penicillium capsulatum]|uniref:Helicase ATP-binding domain-containing protein n=1 Tax=Penicillium capsulatum TaxID=69766 RepID=A0A9W9IKF6_9EURO|nr:hypothetical protein N7492_002644 [Penicillium capsulatum]KAJ6122755.1 hypothetical protein N7512_005220 [Penicillium capsulatum]
MLFMMSSLSLSLSAFYFLFISVSFFPQVFGTPIQHQVAKRGYRITNSKITSVADIKEKAHKLVNNQETEGPQLVESDIDQMVIHYESMEEFKGRSFSSLTVEIRASGFYKGTPRGTLVFYEPDTEDQLKKKFDKAIDVWQSGSAAAFEKIQDPLSKEGCMFSKIMSIGTGSMHSVFRAPARKSSASAGPAPFESNSEGKNKEIKTGKKVEQILEKVTRDAQSRSASQIALPFLLQQKIGGRKIFLQDWVYSDKEKKLLNHPQLLYSEAQEVEVIDDPEAFDIIDEYTLLIAINVGDSLLKLIPQDKMPAVIITDFVLYDVIPKQEPDIKAFFDHYEKITEIPGKTEGLDFPNMGGGVPTLTYVGPFMDRNMDSAPDSRVNDFEPDKWQRDVLDQVGAKKSVFVVAPTSAGKTFISFYAMKQILEDNEDGVLVYVAPTKALVNQIATEV